MSKIGKDVYAKLDKGQRKRLHKAEMAMRRVDQNERLPDVDSRLVHFSKNSLPEYRKDYVRRMKNA